MGSQQSAVRKANANGAAHRPGTAHRPPPTAHFSWQGWRLTLPADWSPLKLEGDGDEGYALFADLARPRLGLRWKRVKAKGDPAKLVERSMRDEVGQLAAREASTPSPPLAASQRNSERLYLDPDPPGRDVYAAFSPASRRLVQLIYHAKHRDSSFVRTVLPTLADAAPDVRQQWSVFDLSCITPPHFTLSSHTLNAGDLSLTFKHHSNHRWLSVNQLLRPPRRMTVRQVAVAGLALSRRPLKQWLAAQQATQKKFYALGRRPPTPVTVVAADGRMLVGLVRTVRRRLRYRWSPRVAPRLVTFALHDESRDRLLLAQGHGKADLRRLLKTVGWANGGGIA